ncbi:ATP-grasp domain-containing protein [Acinetobacter indicus]|uniref:ATP-grasp domain-containing protein n=1 Tax=Acinetobacter indicus TaxID=756892 RepID=UPI00143FC404|nr:ATP-grasp domain-containing protein [Acinetobacter indicus]QIZ59040.1 ATP-grasp domain-containing protein [Acinetobacter indicus]
MAKVKVLVFPAGEVNSIELHDALSTCVNIELFGASSVDRHGSYKFKNYISGLPLITEDNFLEKLNYIIEKHSIDIVIPTHDSVVLFFSKNRDQILSKILVPDGNAAEICRYKSLTYKTLEGYSFIPKIFNDFDEFPLFIKPDDGQGGKDTFLIKDKSEIPVSINLDNYVLCEYLPGEELSVDCFTDKNGELLIVSPRLRERTMAGISVAGRNIEISDEIKYIAECINTKITFLGLWFFQIKKDKFGDWKLLEISTRCASSMSLTRSLGYNLPLMSIYTAMGYDVKPLHQNYNVQMDRTLISRYKIDYEFDSVYIDFDDTIIIRGKVYLPAMWLIYQMNNLGKKVFLITRHEGNLNKTLEKYKISKDLFYEIIHIIDYKPKSYYMNPNKAIFIDNAFQERLEVNKMHNIPVFDVDAIEVLMDWVV